jgi:hypothetical protein
MDEDALYDAKISLNVLKEDKTFGKYDFFKLGIVAIRILLDIAVSLKVLSKRTDIEHTKYNF